MFENMRELRKSEDGAAAIIAILFTIIILFTVFIMATLAISGIVKQSESRDSANISNNVNIAISNAVALANNPLPGNSIQSHIGIENAVYGENETGENVSHKGKWLWYVETDTDISSGVGYIVNATGYYNEPTDDNSRTLKVKLQQTKVVSSNYLPGGNISYTPIAFGNFAWGVMGSDSVNVNSGASVYSFNSKVNQSPTIEDDLGTGTISSNGPLTMNLKNTDDINRVLALNNGIDVSTLGRCSDSLSCDGKVIPYSFNVDLSDFTNVIKATCPLSANSYPNFVSSANNGDIDNNTQGQCFNNILFDTDTKVSIFHNTNNPARMYALGSVTINPSVKVNQSYINGGPLSLRIYSSDDSIILKGGTVSDKTIFSGFIGGDKLECNTDTDKNKPLILKGGLSCRNVTLNEGVTVWLDMEMWNSLNLDNSVNIGSIWLPIK